MRNISFALTTDQVRRRQKTVTRRLGWAKLKPGTLLQPVVKAQGIPKGGHVEKVGGPVRVVDVRREPLRRMLEDPDYGIQEAFHEGFPGLTGRQFVTFFRGSHSQIDIDHVITRIEFEYVEDAG